VGTVSPENRNANRDGAEAAEHDRHACVQQRQRVDVADDVEEERG